MENQQGEDPLAEMERLLLEKGFPLPQEKLEVDTRQLTTNEESKKTRRKKRYEKEVSKYFIYSQREAAKKLGIANSTLSKRWKESTSNKKWPFRIVSKLFKEIVTLLKNIPPNTDPKYHEAIEQVRHLLLQWKQHCSPVFIQMKESEIFRDQ